jgi:tripartite-type tricarboxylate transporter receptor subunit TctC
MNISVLDRVAVVAVSMGLAHAAWAQSPNYPSRTITLIVPYSPGALTDSLARLVADKFRARWSQTVVVENRNGAGGNIGADIVARAPHDGYTLLFTAPGPLVINKSLYSQLSYDPDSFEPVSLVTTSPIMLIVNPKGPAKTMQELIAYAKANPGKLNYASGGIGTFGHLTAELFNALAGIKTNHVPYRGNGPAIVDLLGNQVDLLFADLGAALTMVNDGSLLALGIAGDQRNPDLPNVPNMSEVLPGFSPVAWYGIVAPAGTPSAITKRLSTAVAESLKQPDFAKRLREWSIEAIGSTPAEMATFLKQERQRWGDVIRTNGIKAE